LDRRYTVNRMEIAPTLKLVNAVIGIAGWVGLPFGKLDVDSVLRTAQRKTGLEDWGDEAFIDLTRRLFRLADAARITRLGEIALRQTSYAAVTNRLRIEDYIKRHPDTAEIPIERPVFIVGFPRTGTTLLQNLLALEEGSRALEFWELYQPVPIHEDPAVDRRLRLRKAKEVLTVAKTVAPEMPIVHDIRATTPEEDWLLMCNTGAVMNNDLANGLVRWGDFLMRYDMTGPYREFRRMLQVLAHWKPTGRFVLKCPEHLWFLDDLLEVFPDACIVWPHRDPVSCIASYSSMISLTRRAWYGRIHAEYICDHITDRFLTGVTRGMEVRERVGEDRFFDINFERLSRDPVGAIRDIHQHFDMPHDEGTDDLTRNWLAQPRSDKPGRHVYSAAQWGLEVEEIYRRFAPYTERFGVHTHP